MAVDRSALAKAVNKVIGDEAVEKPLQYLDTGYPPLNFALSGRYDGGFVAGRVYEISGKSSTGKTALLQKLMVEAQKADGYAAMIDWERAWSNDLAQQFGLNIGPEYFAYHVGDTWEDGNTKALKVGYEARKAGITGPIVIGLDSVASAIPASQLYDKDGNERAIDSMTMNDTTALSRVISTTLKVVERKAYELDLTLVYLNQTRTKPGVTHGDPTYTPGGDTMEFHCSGRLRLSRSLVKDAAKEFIGQVITAKAIKSKFTAPFKECELRLMFNENSGAYFDVEQSLIEHLRDIKRIPVNGNYVVWEGKNYYAAQLAKKIREEGKYAELIALLPKVE